MKEYLLQNKFLFAVTIIISVISSVSYVFVAVVLQRILDSAIAGDITTFVQILLFSAVYFLLIGLLLYIHSLLSKKLICKIVNQMRYTVFRGIMCFRMEDFNKKNTGDYISAVNNDVKLVEDNYLIPILEMFQYLIIFLASLGVMIYYDFLITLCIIFAMLLMFILPLVFGGIMQKRQDAYSQKLSIFTTHLKDLLLGFEVISFYHMKSHVLKKFKATNDETINAKYSVNKVEAANDAVSMLLAVFVQIVVIFLAAYFIIIGRITAGMLLALVQISGTLSSPLIMIFQSMPLVKSAKPIVQRLSSYTNYQPTSFVGTEKPTFGRSIAVRDLSFCYHEDEQVLRSITMDLEKGKKYALVGKSGCGKSTLVKLLTGYYSQYQGEIFYDDKELLTLDYEAMKALSGIIHQNVYMFDETIEDNICLHRDYDEQQLAEALEDSGVKGFLDKTPDGLLSSVGENGAKLSGGQKQRIAVARAMIRRKPLLFLDEGTSAIDTQTAYDIEQELLKHKELTLVTITHNMQKDILERYDEILYMEEGVLAEKGSFHTLLDKEGGFYDFFTLKK